MSYWLAAHVRNLDCDDNDVDVVVVDDDDDNQMLLLLLVGGISVPPPLLGHYLFPLLLIRVLIERFSHIHTCKGVTNRINNGFFHELAK